eukprot:jgi/Mesvir1/19470/Mv10492-RA.1
MRLLDGTYLRNRPLALYYKASRDGWNALRFHAKVDGKGPCVVVGTTSDGIRFGGFMPESFKGSDDYYSCFDAFLFFWPTPGPTNGKDPVVLKKVGGGDAAVFDYARGGPQWGADALLIGPPLAAPMGGLAGPESETLGAGDLHFAKCRLGLAYEKPPKSLGMSSLFGNSDKEAQLVEVEVYASPELAW